MRKYADVSLKDAKVEVLTPEEQQVAAAKLGLDIKAAKAFTTTTIVKN